MDKLYGVNDHSVRIQSLRLDHTRTMARITQIKKGLTDLFVKFRVADDKITCDPLVLDKTLY